MCGLHYASSRFVCSLTFPSFITLLLSQFPNGKSLFCVCLFWMRTRREKASEWTSQWMKERRAPVLHNLSIGRPESLVESRGWWDWQGKQIKCATLSWGWYSALKIRQEEEEVEDARKYTTAPTHGRACDCDCALFLTLSSLYHYQHRTDRQVMSWRGLRCNCSALRIRARKTSSIEWRRGERTNVAS